MSPMKTVLLASLVLTSACSSTHEVEQAISKQQAHAATLPNKWKEATNHNALRRLVISDKYDLAAEVVKSSHGDPLPAEWLQVNRIVSLPKPASIREVANTLTFIYGMAVSVDDQPRSKKVTVSEKGDDDKQVIKYRREGATDMLDADKDLRRVDVHGNWNEVFSQIAALYGYAWSYKAGGPNGQGVVSFDKYVTRTFRLVTLGGTTTYNDVIETSGGGSGGSGGTGGDNISGNGSISGSSSVTIDAYQEIQNALINSVLPMDGTAEYSSALGGIVVTAPAWVMPDVEQFMAEQNRAMSRQAAVEVQVFAVSSSKGDSSALNLNLVAKALSGKFGLTFASTNLNADLGGGSLTGSVLTPTNIAGINLKGTQGVVQAFNTVGTVDTIYHKVLYLKNNRPVVFSKTKRRGYLKERPPAAIAGAGTDVTAINSGARGGVVSTGFSLALRGQITDDGRLTLGVRLQISDLEKIEDLAGGIIQSPITEGNDYSNDFYLASGQFVIIDGFERQADRIDKIRGGDALCSFFCRSDKGTGEKQSFFIVLRPVLQRHPAMVEVSR